MRRQQPPAVRAAPVPPPEDDRFASVTTSDLLAELARRFRVRFGRVEAVFHDGRPSPRVVVEHRLHRVIDDLPD